MKRICLLAFLLLALAVPALGVARTLYPAQDAMNWSAAEWSLADDNAKNQAKPAGGDTVYFTFNSGDVTLDENSAALAALAMDAAGDYVLTLALGANTLTVDGSCGLVGTITGTGTIDAGEGQFVQEATVANGVTLLLTTSGSDPIYWVGTGGSVDINCTGTYTLGTACNSYALTVTAGTLAGAEQTWTVGAGGFEPKAGAIFTGTLIVDLSAAAGAYDQTDGEIAAAAVLNVTTGSGGFSFAALTRTGTLNITMAEDANIEWNTYSASALISSLTVNATATLTANTMTKALHGSGEIATTIKRLVCYYVDTNNFWTFTGTVTGNGPVTIFASTGVSNAAAITLAQTGETLFESGDTIALASKLTTAGALKIEGPGGVAVCTLECNGGTQVGGACTLGKTTKSGVLTLGPNRVHTFASTIAMSGTGTANAFNPRGRVILGGTMTGTGIVVTPTYEGVIDCFGAGRVTAVTATGRRLVVRRAVDASGNPVRSWNGDGCTNVRFLGRRLVGSDN